MIKQRRLKIKQGKAVVQSMSMQRIEDIEEKLINQVKNNQSFEESVNVTEVRNKTALNNKNKMT